MIYTCCGSDCDPVSALSGGHRGCKAVGAAEITLDGLHLYTFEPQILHVPERLIVRGVTEVHHKGLVAGSNHVLQVEPADISNLCVPASCLESALTDVGVEWACKCEIVCEQDVERAPVLSLPPRIVFPDNLVVFWTQSGLCVGTRHFRDARCCGQCPGTRLEQCAARYYRLFHDSFLPVSRW